MCHPNGQGGQAGLGTQSDASSRPPLGIISVILVALGGTKSFPSRVMSIERPFAKDLTLQLKRSTVEVRPALSFFEENKIRTIQPYDDALVVTLRIRGYDVNRMLVP